MKLILAAILSAQLFNFILRYRFEKIVKKSGGDRYCKFKKMVPITIARLERTVENPLPGLLLKAVINVDHIFFQSNHNGLLYTSKGVLSNPLYGDLRKSEDFVSANFKRRQLQFQSAVRQSGDISVAPFDQVGRTNFYRHGKFQ